MREGASSLEQVRRNLRDRLAWLPTMGDGHSLLAIGELEAYKAARRVPIVRRALRHLFECDLRRLADVLQATPLADRYWVWGGLLLGWAREGAVLAHDAADADFALRVEDLDRLLASAAAIRAAGFRPFRAYHNNAGAITEVCFLRHGCRFEFFVLAPHGEDFAYCVYGARDGELYQLDCQIPAQPLEDFEFLGRRWLKSADHARELSVIYGPWQVPDPSWSYLDDKTVVRRARWTNAHCRWIGDARSLRSGPETPAP